MATCVEESELAAAQSNSGPDLFVQKRRAVLHDTKKARHTKLAPAKRKLSEDEREAASKVPLEMLAREWLNDHRATLDTRSYLVEKLLPTLVVGLEKLLREVTSRDLVENMEQQQDFNPVNFVAQHLMRNNPRYSNFAEAHPYCSTMKQVGEELKRVAYSLDENKLAELKTRSKQRCQVREEAESRKTGEESRRTELSKGVYVKWLVPKEETVGVNEVKQALLSWAESVADDSLQANLKARLSTLLSETTSQAWKKMGFAKAVMDYGCPLPAVEFNQMVAHLELWGMERCRNKHREKRKELFTSIFESCDPNGTNAMDRLRVLYLLAMYYDGLPSNKREAETVQNPRQWPIMDVVEVEELEEDEETLNSEEKLASLSRQDLLDFYEGAMEEEEGGGAEVREEGVVEAEGGVEKGAVEMEEGKGDEDGGLKEAGDEENVVQEMKGEAKGEKSGEGVKGEEGEAKGEESGEGVKGEESGEGEAKGEVSGEGVKGEESGEGVKGEGEELKEEERAERVKGEGLQGEESAERVKGEEDGEDEKFSDESDTGTKEDEDLSESASSEVKAASVEVEPASTEVKSASSDEKSLSSDGTIEGKKDNVPVRSMLERRLTPGKSREASLLRMREVCGMSTQPLVPSGPGAIWDHETLNKAQFVQLVELFVGREPEQALVNSVLQYIKNNYTETESERSTHLDKAQQQALYLAKRRKVNLLFETWDNNSSGFLELDELQLVLCKWKSFSGEKGKEQVKAVLESLGVQNRLTLSQFQTYIDRLTENMKLEECAEFFEFLITNVKLTFEEQHRGEKRKEFLSQITMAGKTSGLRFLPAAREAVSVLHKDIDMFGDGKHVTVSISLLEPSLQCPDSLTIKAASPAIEARVLKSKLHRTSAVGVGFKAVDNARPVHVLSIQKSGKVCFFLPEHKSSRYDGSLVVVPIISPQQVVLGTISIDSLQPAHTEAKTTFYSHEINFFQGVGLCLGEVQHWMSVHQKLLKVAHSALDWIHRRCPIVSKGEVYIVQPTPERGEGGEGDPYHLSLMLSTTGSQPAAENIDKKFKPHENQFFDYLFECVENSEPVSARVYGQHHLAYPIRDHTGCAVVVVDLCVASPHSLSTQQLREVTKVLKLLTAAFYKLSSTCDAKEEQAKEMDTKMPAETLLSAKSDSLNDGDDSLTVLFDQLMLADLKDKVKRVNNKLFAELRSYVEPPQAVLQVIRALLYIIYPHQQFETWAQCKQNITVSLVKALETYDPLQVKSHPKLDLIKQLIDLPVASLHDHGSLPAKCIFNWVLVCVPLLEYATISVPLSATVSNPLTTTVSAPLSQSSSAPLPSTMSIPMPSTSTTLTPLPSSALAQDSKTVLASTSAPLPSTN